MENAIEVTGMQKVFGKNTAIKQVSFNVKKGEIFGLLGPSGSGKTTTIKILTGEMAQTAGDLKVLGMESAKFGTSEFKSKIGILSDNSSLYERLTVYDNLKLFCKLYNAPLNQIDVMLREVNLYDERSKTVSKLSKGMKQRVLLAKALIHKPELVFLDEPTSALDPGNMVHIHRGLQKLNEAGTTIFLTTHNMEEANELCDRVAFLHNGELQELDSPAALRYKYSTHAFHVETFEGERLVIENQPKKADQVRELIASGQVKAMHTDNPTLGQIFLKVTGKELV
ncbi:bacitracin ABC transporter ATP-binding protein [Virgibacillus profundi]|uniref:Bacitracin ABC transporter ATP-binding protein n=1 Tax=Virgibacillus profundi TaxID=2024555 RepID=A0A2A2IBU8_9BACI|nr:ABC transporter ATP-binding protein [Virgibacillus profundi]PAV28600.1 bacitracin ABC transporter ATP-binding protein [Virgibacillus profundi]PXY52768.1 ABC transporter ATP-binding protein [Virgibacillus profundi]